VAISSTEEPLASSPISTDAFRLQQQLLEEKKISAKLRGELARNELVRD